jgi:hypothetical protein
MVNEHVKPLTVEEQAPQREAPAEEQERTLTQRELVRASLLRCPPPDPADAPQR